MSSRNLDRLVRLFNLNVPGTITMENEIPPMLPAQRLFAPSPSPSDPYTSQPRGPTQLPLLSVQRRARERLRLQIEIVGNPRSLRRRVVNRSCKSAGGVFSSSATGNRSPRPRPDGVPSDNPAPAEHRVRIERNRTRQPVGRELQPKHSKAYADARECDLPRPFHRLSSRPRRMP
jgi:hypothetical protein